MNTLVNTLLGPKTLLPVLAVAACYPLRNWWRADWRHNSLKRNSLAGYFALASYATIVLLFNYAELFRWHHISETLYPALGGAWGFEHLVGLLVAWFVYSRASEPPSIFEESTIFLRGRRLIAYSLAFQIAKSRLKRGEEYLWWGLLPVHPKEAVKNFLVVGAPGSGKTVAIELFLKCIVPPMRPGSRSRMVLYDAKSDLFPTLAAMKPSCPIFTLNTEDRRCYAWNLASDIRTPKDAKEVAAILVPEKPGDKDPFFTGYTRLLFQGVIESFILSTPDSWTLRDVLLALKSPKRLDAVLSRHPETRDILANLGEDRVRANVFSTVEIERKRYSTIAAVWHKIWPDEKRRVSLSQWINGESIMLLGQATAEGSPLRGLNQMVLQRLAELLDRQPNSRTERTWFILDELTDLQYVRGLDLLLRRGRSKGVAAVLGFQTWPGMVDAFQPALAAQITALCAYKSFLHVNDPPTAAWAAKHFGDYEALEYRLDHSESWKVGGNDSSQSRSLRGTQVTRPSVMPEQLLTLPPTDEANGFNGFHLSPQFKDGYAASASWSWTIAHLTPPEKGVPCVEPWRKDEAPFQYLEDWTDADCERLKLPPVKEIDSSPKSAPDTALANKMKNLSRENLDS